MVSPSCRGALRFGRTGKITARGDQQMFMLVSHPNVKSQAAMTRNASCKCSAGVHRNSTAGIGCQLLHRKGAGILSTCCWRSGEGNFFQLGAHWFHVSFAQRTRFRGFTPSLSGYRAPRATFVGPLVRLIAPEAPGCAAAGRRLSEIGFGVFRDVRGSCASGTRSNPTPWLAVRSIAPSTMLRTVRHDVLPR